MPLVSPENRNLSVNEFDWKGKLDGVDRTEWRLYQNGNSNSHLTTKMMLVLPKCKNEMLKYVNRGI